MTEMTTGQYKKIRGVRNTVGITRAMNLGKRLIGVHSYRKVGRDWVLLVDIEAAKKNPKKVLVIQE